MKKIFIYEVDREYIEYLREIDETVRKEKDHPGAKSRKYIGILMKINGCDYFAPLASPKKKFEHMKNDKDFIKVEGGKYGAINLNNMIPVHPSGLIRYDINTESDTKYKNILLNQARFIRKNTSQIISAANELYEIMTGTDKENENERNRMKDRCCKYKELEEASKNYKKQDSTN
ncbi:type III toxin-antitoxin system ToxN/AbiQ family toxin [Planococcus sp. A6]|uniref:type III toxin-antitoxin system ToxN/AbiQ family toxin n=1 Tax=Planococcus sp. A6 TaxID=2992760 RepID=UPI00237AB3D2|nr:type III toxin-antitoxin system ToxN/AbiQ family toxin [Planococcus sp. A6]MDE0584698.1 type III toxin-antitoxin system ToxN/AbiQ family toxin [Planococcus sp. A6]